MSLGRLPSARKRRARPPVRKVAVTGKETLILDAAERKAALLRVIGSAGAVPPHLPIKLDHFETANAQRCA